VRRLGQLLGTSAQAEAFIRREKQTTLQAVWDLWKGPQSDWFHTTSIGIVATGTYVDGLITYLGEELGMNIVFAVRRPRRPDDLDTETLRDLLHSRPPSFVFGSINEKIYLSEGGKKQTTFLPAAFPGPVVRRSMGTPFMGFHGTVYLVQEIVNQLYETLYNFLPLDSAYARAAAPAAGGPPPAAAAATAAVAAPGNLPWAEEARAVLDAALEKLPFLARISASRELQMQVEAEARARGIAEITRQLAAEVLNTHRK
jgi:chlorophyllide a reductase subunit Z